MSGLFIVININTFNSYLFYKVSKCIVNQTMMR